MNKLFKQAFTLIELLVVIAVIGILSGLIVVSMSGTSQKATIAKAQIFSNSLRNSLMSNIIAQYNFDDIDSNDYDPSTKIINNDADNIPDSWSSNEGRAYGGPTLKEKNDCVYGSCIYFDGYDDYIEIPDNDAWAFGTNNFLIEAWIKMFRIQSGDENVLYSQRIDDNNRLMLRILGAGGRVYLYGASGGVAYAYYQTGSNVITSDSWTHVVVERLGTVAKCFVNGKEITFTETTAFASSSVPNFATPLRIGADTSLAVRYFIGSIDNFRIYNSAMSNSQIKEQYYAGLNNLLLNGEISQKEYQNRIGKLTVTKP